jgi:hypothetical protein
MTEVTIRDKQLVVEIKGWDKFWSFKKRLEIPLDHVLGVREAVNERVSGFRAPGTRVPGIITAGTFRKQGKKIFWDVHNRANAIAIDLREAEFAKLVIEVSDPEKTIAEIQTALGPTNIDE